jgi:hypothetical protein
MTGPLGLALLLIVAVMPGAFAQSELKRPLATGSELSDLGNPARDLEASRRLSNLLLPDAQSSNKIITNGASTSPPAPLSPWATDVVKLANAGLENDVILAFIDNSGIFSLDADQIVSLHETGVPSQFVTAMIQHDADVTAGIRPLTITADPSTHHPIQFVLVPVSKSTNKQSKSLQTSPTSLGASPALSHTSDAVFPLGDDEFSQDELDLLAALHIIPVPLQEEGTNTTTLKQEFYRVREPFPEQVTPPIIVFKGASMAPNTLLIQFPH